MISLASLFACLFMLILFIRSKTQVTRDILDEATDLLAIGCYCIGTDQVDCKAATLKGIIVFNSPFSNSRSVGKSITMLK